MSLRLWSPFNLNIGEEVCDFLRVKSIPDLNFGLMSNIRLGESEGEDAYSLVLVAVFEVVWNLISGY